RGVLRGRGDVAVQVIKHAPGGGQCDVVVLEHPVMRPLAGGDRRTEHGEVGVVELAQRPASLDQKTHRDLAGKPGSDLAGVAHSVAAERNRSKSALSGLATASRSSAGS